MDTVRCNVGGHPGCCSADCNIVQIHMFETAKSQQSVPRGLVASGIGRCCSRYIPFEIKISVDDYPRDCSQVPPSLMLQIRPY